MGYEIYNGFSFFQIYARFINRCAVSVKKFGRIKFLMCNCVWWQAKDHNGVGYCILLWKFRKNKRQRTIMHFLILRSLFWLWFALNHQYICCMIYIKQREKGWIKSTCWLEWMKKFFGTKYTKNILIFVYYLITVNTVNHPFSYVLHTGETNFGCLQQHLTFLCSS